MYWFYVDLHYGKYPSIFIVVWCLISNDEFLLYMPFCTFCFWWEVDTCYSLYTSRKVWFSAALFVFFFEQVSDTWIKASVTQGSHLKSIFSFKKNKSHPKFSFPINPFWFLLKLYQIFDTCPKDVLFFFFPKTSFWWQNVSGGASCWYHCVAERNAICQLGHSVLLCFNCFYLYVSAFSC